MLAEWRGGYPFGEPERAIIPWGCGIAAFAEERSLKKHNPRQMLYGATESEMSHSVICHTFCMRVDALG